MSDYWGVMPAAGCGERFSRDTPKQYIRIADACVLEHSLNSLLCSNKFVAVVVSLARDDTLWAQTKHSGDSRVMICEGGANRASSIMNALVCLQKVAKKDDWIVVHDAVRPCLDPRDLSSFIEELTDEKVGGLLVAPISDTVKKISHSNGSLTVVEQTLDRKKIVRALTPQMFRFGLLFDAINDALSKSIEVSDEAQAMELAGHEVVAIEGDSGNIKLTYPHELPLIKSWLMQHIG